MIAMRRIKILFLFVISTLFCYRAALLNIREYSDAEREMIREALYNIAQQEAQEYIEAIMSATTKPIHQHDVNANNSKAGAAEDASIKLNTQLKHHAYMVKQMLENGKSSKSALNKIEAEIKFIETAAQKLGVSGLLDQALITDIKKSIAYLRMQS